MNRRILSVVCLVFLLAACLIPATSYGENPWDPDSPSGGRGTTISATASSSNGGPVTESTVSSTQAEEQKAAYHASDPQQPRSALEETWLDWVKTYWQRLFVLLAR